MRLAAPRFVLAQSALNLLGGLYMPFFPLWLTSNGIRPEGLSSILAAGMFARIFVSPMSGAIADTLGDRRAVAVALALISCVLFGLLAWLGPSGGYLVIFLFTAVGATLHAGLGPIVEAQTARGADDYGFHYARVRAAGSFTFVVSNLLGGALVAQFGIGWLAVWVACIIAVQALCFLALPRLKADAKPHHGFGVTLKRTLAEGRMLMRAPAFLLFIAAAGAAQATHGVYYAFGTMNFLRQGFSTGFIGALWGIGVFAEVLLMLVAPWLLRDMRPVRLMQLGIAGAALRWTGMAFDTGPAGAAALQLLHACSFALVHLGTMKFLNLAVPVRLSATAQSLFAVTAYGGLTGLVTLAAGPLYRAFEGGAYVLPAILALAAGALSIGLARNWQGGKLLPDTHSVTGAKT